MGLQLRNDDPVAMKEFVVGVHARAAELGQQGSEWEGRGGDNSKKEKPCLLLSYL